MTAAGSHVEETPLPTREAVSRPAGGLAHVPVALFSSVTGPGGTSSPWRQASHVSGRSRRRLTVWATLLPTALLSTTVLAGCGSDGTDSLSPTQPAAAPADVPAGGAELNAAEFAAALQAPRTVILDVRTPAEFAQGHLPGAVNLDVQSPTFGTHIAALDPAVPYAVYCRSGNRSQVALDLMEQAGISSAYHLGGGIGAWERAGGEVVTG